MKTSMTAGTPATKQHKIQRKVNEFKSKTPLLRKTLSVAERLNPAHVGSQVVENQRHNRRAYGHTILLLNSIQ